MSHLPTHHRPLSPLAVAALCAAVAASPLAPAPAVAAGAPATNHLILDATTGFILEAGNENRKVQIGSLTKIATACVALDWLDAGNRDAGEEVTLSPNAAATPGQNPVGFRAGDRATMRDLLYAALLQSDNVAAQGVAEHVGQFLPGEGSAAVRFIAQMNALARQLGMERTLFLNPHGIDGLEKKLPYSTAADVGRLAKYAMAKASFRFYVSQPERPIAIRHQDGTGANFNLRNTNELVGRKGVDGVKTGMTARAGGCVVVSAQLAPESKQEGDQFIVTPRRIIVVVLGSDRRFDDAAALLDRGWNLYNAWAAAGRPLKRDAAL